MRKNVRGLFGFKLLLSVFVLSACILIPSVQARADHLLSSEALKFNQNYSVVCPTRGDYREYKITLTQSGKIDFAVSLEGGWGTSWLTDSNDENLFAWTAGGGSVTFSKELLAGDYKFNVLNSGYDYREKKFSFTSTFTPSGETINESQSARNNQVTTATAYTQGKTHKGHLADNDEKDVYRFNVAKDGITTVNYNPQFAASSLHLVNLDGDVEYEERYLEFGQQSFRFFTPKGTYYLTVYANDKDKAKGTYTLSANSKVFSGVKSKKLKSGKKYGVRYITVKWSTNPDATGYEVRYSTKKNFKKSSKTLVSGAATNKVTLNNKIKKKKTYYVKVRAYRDYGNGKRVFSSWSKVQKVTTKN